MAEGLRLERAEFVGANLETWGPTAIGEEVDKPTHGKAGDSAVEGDIGVVRVSKSILCGGCQA